MTSLLTVGLMVFAGIATAADADSELAYVQKYRAEAERQRQAAIAEMAAKLEQAEKEYTKQKDYYDYLKRGVKKRRLAATVESLRERRDQLRAELDKLRRNDPPFEPVLPTLKPGKLAVGDLGQFPVPGAVEQAPCRGGGSTRAPVRAISLNSAGLYW